MSREKTRTSNILAAVAIGASCMYLMDPVNGKRRRTRVRDKFARLSHAVEDGAETAVRDLTNRIWGFAATAIRSLHHVTNDDAVLEPRVRSEMGRWVSSPHSIHVEARNGHVILSGDILASEQKSLLRHLVHIPGVTKVESQMRVHEGGEEFPVRQNGSRGEGRQEHWAPGHRLLAAVTGSAMIGGGLRDRGIAGWGTVIGGSILMARAITNSGMMRLLGIDTEIRKEEKPKPAESGVSIPITRKEPRAYRVH